MNAPLFSPEEIQFIQEHLNDEPSKLMLQARRYPHLPIAKLVRQIQARQKAQHKLPDWYANTKLVFPANLSVEQCSSQVTALFKASLIHGESIADLTGGMGVDTAYLAQGFQKAFHFEQNQELQEIVAYNFEQLGLKHITFVGGNSIDWLNAQNPTNTHFSWIYLDPHRRDEAGGKVFALSDCEPDVVKYQDLLFQFSENILIKASPMLDLDQSVRELKSIKQIWVISVDNEVKEVLFHLKSNHTDAPLITCVALYKNQDTQTLSFYKEEEAQTAPSIGQPARYLYEPNVALLKAGAFKLPCSRYGLQKIAPHSHLYTSEVFQADFIGRSFEVLAVCKLDKKAIAPFISNNQANITIRNFPLTVKQIREKLKIQEGGNTYLFATTDAQGQKIVIVCQKVTS